MGQSLPKQQPINDLSPQAIAENIRLLFEQLKSSEKLEAVNQPIIVITRHLAVKGSFSKTPEGNTRVNSTLLNCLYHPNFQNTIQHLMLLLAKQLKNIHEAKLIALVSREKFRKCLNIANFCIFFTDQNLIQTVNLLSVRTDIDSESKELVSQLSKQAPELNPAVLDSLQLQKLLQICKILRQATTLMIDLHLKLLTRSDFTLKIIDRLIQSLYVLYVKVVLQSQDKQVARRELGQNGKAVLRLGGYFIGLGLETNSSSVYELGVLVVQRLVGMKGEELAGQKALPSHLFKSLPVVNNNDMMSWLTNNILFALKYVKKDNNLFARMNFNRLPSFKLLTHIFQKHHPQSTQIAYLLEQICLQTKNFQIERVYVTTLAELYSKLPTATQIIQKYAQVGHISFNLKGNAKEITIKPQDVRTELESDDESLRKEVAVVCGKYTVQVIFKQSEVFYEYSDTSLWNMILGHLEQEGRAEQQSTELSKEGEEDKD